MFLIITPVFLLLVLWSSIDPFEYKKINDAYNCTDIVSKKCVCTCVPHFSVIPILYHLSLTNLLKIILTVCMLLADTIQLRAISD